MRKIDFIQLIQDRAAGGDVTNDTLQKFKENTIAATINNILTEALYGGRNMFSNVTFGQSRGQDYTDRGGRNMLSNVTFGFAYTALTGNYYIDLTATPLGSSNGVKTVVDDCGNTYFGRRTFDQNVLMTKIRQLALPEFFVNDSRLTFSSEPKGTAYTVYMTPDFVEMDDDAEFTCPSIDQIVSVVVDKLKATNNEPTELINNTKPDKG
jgi:hypothetical protein